MDRSQGEPRTTRGYAPTKRAIDLAICILALPILLPVGLLCALAIRLETPGAVLFAQQRTGQHGVRFPMFKFRTMVRNAEELKASLQHLNILPPPDFKIPNDPRVTQARTTRLALLRSTGDTTTAVRELAIAHVPEDRLLVFDVREGTDTRGRVYYKDLASKDLTAKDAPVVELLRRGATKPEATLGRLLEMAALKLPHIRGKRITIRRST